MIIVSARPNPFEQPVVCRIDPGLSVAEILGGRYDDVQVALNGWIIPVDDWSIIPADGIILTAVRIPQGPVKAIAIVVAQAVAAAAAQAAVAIGASSAAAVGIGTALGVAAGVITQVGLTIGLSLLPALIRPQAPTIQSPGAVGSRYTALTGGANREDRFNVIPKLYGTYRITPPLAGSYYTMTRNNNQFMLMLLCLGYGPMNINGNYVGEGYSKIGQIKEGGSWIINTDIDPDIIRIGETDISEFHVGGGLDWEIGTPSQITLYTKDVKEQVFSIEFKHVHPGGEGGWFVSAGGVQAETRTTDDNAKNISIDIQFPALITVGKDGTEEEAIVEWEIKYSIAGLNNWITVDAAWQTAGKSKSPLRFSKKWKASAADRYDVRIRRLRTWIEDENVRQVDAVWTALRSTNDIPPWNATPPAGVDSVVLMAMQIKSTGQLNGNIDPVSIVAESVLPVWTGTTWTDLGTGNPAWVYADILRGPQLRDPVSDDRIDKAQLAEWASWCDTKGFTYNWYHTNHETILDRLRAVATTGRATWAMPGGRFSVILDTDFTPVQMITPRNSRNFSFERRYPKIPHALRVRFMDPQTYQETERIVYADGYDESTATIFEILETQGVTDADQAYSEGRYFLAALILRPETYHVEMDFENLACTRGDTVFLSHDVLLVGIKQGRIKSLTVNIGGAATAAELDELVEMEGGKSYGLRIRRHDNTYTVAQVVTAAGSTHDVTFTSPVTGLNAGDLFAFGIYGAETILAKISEIDYQEDLSASLTLIPAAPDIVDADSGPIPPWNPGITPPNYLNRPPAPHITLLAQSGEGVRSTPSGEWIADVIVGWTLPPSSVPVDIVEAHYEVAGMSAQSASANQEAGTMTLPNLPYARTVSVMLRARSIWGKWSDWSDPSSLLVGSSGTLTCPGPVNFQATGTVVVRLDGTVDNNILLTWEAPASGQLDHYEAQWLAPGADWTGTVAPRDSLQYTIAGLLIQEYDVRLRAVSPIGVASDWATINDVTPGAKATPPGDIDNLAATGGIHVITYTWDNPADADLSYVELVASMTNDRTTAASICKVSGNRFDFSVTGAGTWYAWGRAADTSGNTSGWYPSSSTGGISSDASNINTGDINDHAVTNTVMDYVDYDQECSEDVWTIIGHKAITTTGASVYCTFGIFTASFDPESVNWDLRLTVEEESVETTVYERLNRGVRKYQWTRELFLTANTESIVRLKFRPNADLTVQDAYLFLQEIKK